MKYVFIEYCITGIGGGQKYIANKVEYLTKKGWDVYVFSQLRTNDIVINSLKQYVQYERREFASNPLIFNKRRVKKIVEWVCNSIGESDTIVVESGYEIGAYWGEMIAEKCNAKHIAFLLSENNKKIDQCFIPFFEFKQTRNELIGIVHRSIIDLFEGKSNVLETTRPLTLRAHCTNSVSDVYYDWLDSVDNTKINIISIGRLSKGYIPDLFIELKKLCQDHLNSQFRIIIIGGTEDEKSILDEIKRSFTEIYNAEILAFGVVYPIPRELLKRSNVVVASSGCALLSYRENAVTIAIDSNDHDGIGVVGYTTLHKTLRGADEPRIKISKLIEDVIFNGYLKDKKYNPPDTYEQDSFDEHISIIDFDLQNKYYNIMSIVPSMTLSIKMIKEKLKYIKQTIENNSK